MDLQSKRLEFLQQAATMQERREGTDSEGRLRSDYVAAALGWSVADLTTYFGGGATDLVKTDLAPQGLVQVSLRLQSRSGPVYNYIFAVSAAGYALARPPTAALPAGGVEGSAVR
jgi:hypothetical protein